ncbi:hypothetical protein LTSEURB_3428, partial [Salmonella enterica subsp. enterica serovar Urbana str. R8-2977]
MYAKEAMTSAARHVCEPVRRRAGRKPGLFI